MFLFRGLLKKKKSWRVKTPVSLLPLSRRHVTNLNNLLLWYVSFLAHKERKKKKKTEEKYLGCTF
jgi:hypothetical protein